MEYNTSNCHGRGRRSKYFQTCLSRLAVANSLQVAVKIVAVEKKRKRSKKGFKKKSVRNHFCGDAFKPRFNEAALA